MKGRRGGEEEKRKGEEEGRRGGEEEKRKGEEGGEEGEREETVRGGLGAAEYIGHFPTELPTTLNCCRCN